MEFFFGISGSFAYVTNLIDIFYGELGSNG